MNGTKKETLWQHKCYLHRADILAEMQRRYEQAVRVGGFEGHRENGNMVKEITDNGLQSVEILSNGTTGEPLDEQGNEDSRRRPLVGFRDEETGLQKDPG